jgi:hypothetical protein
MTNYYVLSINPHAQYNWDRCIIRNPITGERPDLLAAIAQMVGNKPGSYLVAVNIEVEVLEQAPLLPSEEVILESQKETKVFPVGKSKELIAS